MSESFHSELGHLYRLSEARTRSLSAENPAGSPGAGGKEASNLGPGRKGRPCLDLSQGAATTLAEIEGPGIIQHIWFTVTDRTEKGEFVLRDLVLRMYWDGEETPSVEVPLGDFFCNGFGLRANVVSLPIAVNPSGGMNCYFPMPFARSARIVVENQHPGPIGGFFYQITYAELDAPPAGAACFHAQWRRENPTGIGRDHVILDGVRGRGHYVGTYLAWAALSRHWWGEGEMKFYLDGDREWPTICGTGTEDYAGGAWCFGNAALGAPESYCTPFLGYRYYDQAAKINPWFGHNVPMHGIYRWHIMDPIRFTRALRVTIQQIGHDGKALFERSDDVSSTAYWYQTEPHAPFPALPPARERWPR
ncbi:MAG: glycoside hydrolase family 172 protein [Bacteroidota bacterium]